jgi:hypothetical protein
VSDERWPLEAFWVGIRARIPENEMHVARLSVVPIRGATKTRIAAAKNGFRTVQESRNVNQKRRDYAGQVTLLFILS